MKQPGPPLLLDWMAWVQKTWKQLQNKPFSEQAS